MLPLIFADGFLAGSLLTWVLPIGLLIVIAIWYMLLLKRMPADTPAASAALPTPEVLAAADPAAEDIVAIPPADDA
jgi:hypothetical protein